MTEASMHKDVSDLPPVNVRGVDHLALNTDDMAKTLEFYTKVFGFRLVHTLRNLPAPDEENPLLGSKQDLEQGGTPRRPPGAPPYDDCRHYFLDMGNDSLLAWFEFPPDAPRGHKNMIGGMQHVAFHITKDDFARMQERLDALGIDYLGPLHLGKRFTTINIEDPNGIRLEVTTDVGSEGEFSAVESVLQTEDELRAELSTLYDDPEKVEEMLRYCRTKEREAVVS
jgi:catechol 2,3-dioxygenase-like lactoylglutathione lyase family enzyme